MGCVWNDFSQAMQEQVLGSDGGQAIHSKKMSEHWHVLPRRALLVSILVQKTPKVMRVGKIEGAGLLAIVKQAKVKTYTKSPNFKSMCLQ